MAVADPPGPPGTRFGGNLAGIRANFLNFLLATAREYGDITHFRAGPAHMYLFRHPDHIADILVKRAAIFQKTRSTKKLLCKFLGGGLIALEGEKHRTHRRLMQPAFHMQRIATYADKMVNHTRDHITNWKPGVEYDIPHEMDTLTLGIVMDCLFSASHLDRAKQATAAMTVFSERMAERLNTAVPMPDWVPTSRNRAQRKAIQTMDVILMDIIRERRASGDDTGDLLSMLLESVDEDGVTRLTDKEIRDELLTMFFAGHETTADTLNWVWYLLSQHPDVEARLHMELATVLGGQPPTLDDLQHLPYLANIVRETLRLYPPAWLFDREPVEDVEIGGYTIPKGRTLFISPYVTHRDPRYYDEPERFNPDRFADDFDERVPRYAYVPFGGGPRMCIGNLFAQTEISLVVATIAQHYQLALSPGQTIVPRGMATLTPEFGLRMTVASRQAETA